MTSRLVLFYSIVRDPHIISVGRVDHLNFQLVSQDVEAVNVSAESDFDLCSYCEHVLLEQVDSVIAGGKCSVSGVVYLDAFYCAIHSLSPVTSNTNSVRSSCNICALCKNGLCSEYDRNCSFRYVIDEQRSLVSINCSKFRIIMDHLIPNCMSPMIVQATMGVAQTITTASGLSFIGLGVQPPIPEWGAMLSGARQFIRQAPHLVIFPGLAIAVTVLALNMMGDGLRDALDPKLKN